MTQSPRVVVVRTMSVSMTPGQSALTRMPRGRSSASSASVMPTTAAFEVA